MSLSSDVCQIFQGQLTPWMNKRPPQLLIFLNIRYALATGLDLVSKFEQFRKNEGAGQRRAVNARVRVIASQLRRAQSRLGYDDTTSRVSALVRSRSDN